MNTHLNFTVVLLALALPSVVLGAETQYSPGYKALEVFDADAMPLTPTWVKAWIFFLFCTFAAGIYFAWKHPLARWPVGGFIVSVATGQLIFNLLNLPFLGGSIATMHILCWSPGLILLLLKRPYSNAKEPLGFRIWSCVMILVISFSFVFDFRDAAIYFHHILVK